MSDFEISKACYGCLPGVPARYEIVSRHAFTLYAQITVPDIRGARPDYRLTILGPDAIGEAEEWGLIRTVPAMGALVALILLAGWLLNRLIRRLARHGRAPVKWAIHTTRGPARRPSRAIRAVGGRRGGP